jgi:hypothetical protein
MTDPDRERETTIIHTDSGGGGGGGTVIAVVLLIAILALLFYLFGGQLMGTKKADINVDVNTPAAPAKSG